MSPLVPCVADSPASYRHGADARAETFNGNTPAHLAAERGHLLVLTALLQVGAQCHSQPFAKVTSRRCCSLTMRLGPGRQASED